jgi:hypothetical protein
MVSRTFDVVVGSKAAVAAGLPDVGLPPDSGGIADIPGSGFASENYRQTVRQKRLVLIHTASAAMLSLGTFHPSIIKNELACGRFRSWKLYWQQITLGRVSVEISVSCEQNVLASARWH